MRWRCATAGLVLATTCATAWAHDTWFQPLRHNPAGALLALGTGNRYPVQEFGIAPAQLQRHGCRGSVSGEAVALSALQVQPQSLLMRSGPPRPAEATTCWAEVMPFEVELTPALVAVYLDEVRADDGVRARWAAMQARGQPWKERYTKHARLWLPAPDGTAATPGRPTPMALDLVPEREGPAPAPGQPLRLQLLKDGQPLAGLALELVDDQGGSAGWQRSDAEGRVTVTPPRPGAWLVRGTWLAPSADDPALWQSRFVTLALTAAAR